MPVEAQTIEYVYLGDGVTRNFPFPSKFLAASDIVVGVGGVLTTAVTITGAGLEAGGNVNITAAPALGTKVVLLRSPPISQLLDFVNGTTVLEGTLDTGLDKLTMICQYLARALSRTVHIHDLDLSTAAETLLLPAAASRANTLLAFDANGNMQLTTAANILATSVVGVFVSQVKYALSTYGAVTFYKVQDTIPADPMNKLNAFWTGGGLTTTGDSLYLFIKAALGWTDGQMAALYSAAGGVTL